MSKFDKAAKQFQSAVIDMLGIDYTTAMSIITGTFVSVTLEAMRRNGHEPSGEIRLECGDSRDVTIHAAKSVPAASQGGSGGGA